MTYVPKLVVGALLLTAVPTLSAAGQFSRYDRHERMRMRAEIRREIREALTRARRDMWFARDEARRQGWNARREVRQAQREMRNAMRDTFRHRWWD